MIARTAEQWIKEGKQAVKMTRAEMDFYRRYLPWAFVTPSICGRS
jgi:bacteriorhodopsin